MAYNILIVDDSAVVRKVIRKVLTIAEIETGDIHEAANGAEALTVLEQNWIDLVFADLHMPVMSGIEMVDRMSKNGMLDSIPVVIVSSDGSETRINELTHKGVKAYIQKPFTPEVLRETIQTIMHNGGEE